MDEGVFHFSKASVPKSILSIAFTDTFFCCSLQSSAPAHSEAVLSQTHPLLCHPLLLLHFVLPSRVVVGGPPSCSRACEFLHQTVVTDVIQGLQDPLLFFFFLFLFLFSGAQNLNFFGLDCFTMIYCNIFLTKKPKMSRLGRYPLRPFLFFFSFFFLFYFLVFFLFLTFIGGSHHHPGGYRLVISWLPIGYQ